MKPFSLFSFKHLCFAHKKEVEHASNASMTIPSDQLDISMDWRYLVKKPAYCKVSLSCSVIVIARDVPVLTVYMIRV